MLKSLPVVQTFSAEEQSLVAEEINLSVGNILFLSKAAAESINRVNLSSDDQAAESEKLYNLAQ